MTLPVTAEPLPSSYNFGKVVGRVIHLIADTAEDTDDRPQARPGAGKVYFEPKEVLRKTTEADYPAIVLHARESANLSGSGRILDAEGRQGIWLAVGIYTVTFDITGASRAIPSFDIEVTTDYTDEAPLDLATVVPYVPPTGTVVQTVVVPAGGTEGQVLVRTADGGLVWSDQTATGGGAVDSVNGQTGVVVLDAADVGAQPAGDYATTTALTSGLAGKQDAGDYATATELSDGLATKVNSATYTAGIADAKDRANHTGTQPASTVTGLATVATSGSYNDLADVPAAEGVDEAANYTWTGAHDFVGATVTGITGTEGPEGPPGPVGMVWRGPWDTDFSYAADDGVSHSGRSFIALQASTGVEPPTTATSSAYWDLLADRGEQGTQGPAGSGAAGMVTPGDLGFLAWSFDPLQHISSTGSPAANEFSGVLINMAPGNITAIQYRVWSAGSGLTSAQVGIVELATGNRIAVASNQVANMESTGVKRATVDGGPIAFGGGLCYVGTVIAGTSMPSFPRCSGDTGILNMSGNTVIRSGQVGAAGITSIPATLDMGQNAAGPRGFLFCVEGTPA